MKQQVVSAMTYLIILLTFSIGVVFALLTFVMPQVVDQFVRAGATLPLLTRSLMIISDYAWLFLILISASVVGIYYIYKRMSQNKKTEIIFHRNFLRLPIIGNFILNADLERFARIMHLMLKSGLNLDIAILQAHVVIGNKFIA